MPRCWTDSHITTETLTLPNGQEISVFIGWDETGAYHVRVSSSLQEVQSALKLYACYLDSLNGSN